MFYAADLEADGLLDEITKIHCFGFNEINSDNFFVFCRLKELEREYREKFENQGIQFFELDKVTQLLQSSKTKGFSWQNCSKYDFEVIKMFYGLDYDWRGISGCNQVVEDTYVQSMYLNPIRQLPKGCPSSIKYVDKDGNDRSKKVGPHSLESWAYRTGTHKPFVDDWRDQPLHIYVDRVIEDCVIQKATHFAQQKEIINKAISSNKTKGDWEKPLKMAHKNFFLIGKQERDGAVFDKDYGWEVLAALDKEMKELEDELNPLFGERILPKNQQANFPKNPFNRPFDINKMFKKTGGIVKSVSEYLDKINIPEAMKEDYICSMLESEKIDGNTIIHNHVLDEIPKHLDLLSKDSYNYGKKIGITNKDELFKEIIRVLDGGEPVLLTEKTGLRDVAAVKEFLVRDGWKPTLWNFRNVLTDPKTKKKLSKKDTEDKILSYIDEFKDHVFWPFILIELGYKPDTRIDPYSESFKKRCLKNGRNLLSSPQFKDQNGIRCPNLKELTGDVSKKIIRFMSLKHRRSMLKSTDPKKKDTHGLLNNKRLKKDGRITAGIIGLAASTRKRHFGIVNIPKPKKEVVYGKEMRSLFKAPEGWWNIGADAVSVEALVASHWTIPFDGGIYAKNVLTGKFHDDNAKAYSEKANREITRSSGKNISYALLYGASAKKIARMMSVPVEVAKDVVDAFWEVNPGLKGIKDAITEYWKRTDKKYIIGLDGRKIFSRSEHSLINYLFQSTSAILLDFTLCYWYDKCLEENLTVQRWVEVHDEIQFYHKKDEVEIFTFNQEPEQRRGGKLYSAPKEINGKWQQAYSRAGEIVDLGFKAASKYYKTNVEFGAEYMHGINWGECH